MVGIFKNSQIAKEEKDKERKGFKMQKEELT
jgi:hypothetical protein